MLIKVIILEQYFVEPNDSRDNNNKILVSEDDSVKIIELQGRTQGG